MPITDFLDNVPPTPEGFKPYTPPPIRQDIPIDPGLVPGATGTGNGNGAAPTPAGQFPPIPNNIVGWFMLMMGL